MIEITGKYNTAKVFTNSLEDLSREQIERLCDQPFAAESTIRLMPDVHAGAGCAIGTTMTIKDKIVPNLVGVDIGCGMETLVITADNPASKGFDPVRLDKIIHSNIPSGMDIRDTAHEYAGEIALDKIKCPAINTKRAIRSVGTLGGGNHFEELGLDAPLHVQYFNWLKKVARFDFGISFQTKKPVIDEIMRRFPATVYLALTSMILAVAISIPFALLCARDEQRDSPG